VSSAAKILPVPVNPRLEVSALAKSHVLLLNEVSGPGGYTLLLINPRWAAQNDWLKGGRLVGLCLPWIKTPPGWCSSTASARLEPANPLYSALAPQQGGAFLPAGSLPFRQLPR